MLKFFFYRRGWVLRFVNCLALAEGLGLLCLKGREYFFDSPGGMGTLFLICSWFIFKLLDLIPWYPSLKEKWGIRIHMEKNLVPVSYLTFIAFTLQGLGLPSWTSLPFGILLLPIYYVSGILLFLHFRDPSTRKPGYFSQNLYLKEETV